MFFPVGPVPLQQPSRGSMLLKAAVAITVWLASTHPASAQGPVINLVNHCTYSVLVQVGSQNGTLYQNEYELVSPTAVGVLNQPAFQTLLLSGSWPLGLAFATRVNGTVATQALLDIPVGANSDIFHISLESGYSVPVEIEPFATTGSPAQNLACCPKRCSVPDEEAASMCKAPNLLENGQDSDFGACENVDGTKKSPTDGTRAFKNMCRSASTFSGDISGPNGTSVLGSCGRGSNYNINFCPSGTPAVCPAPAAPAPAPLAGPVAQAAPKGSSSNTGAIAGGVVGGLVGAALVLLIAFFVVRRRSGGKRRQDQHLMPSVVSSPWDQAVSEEAKPAWYRRFIPVGRSSQASSSRRSETSMPIESSTTVGSSLNSMQLTGSKNSAHGGGELRATAPKPKQYFPSLPPKASIPFDDLGIQQLGQADVRSQVASSAALEQWELPRDLEKIWMIDSKELHVALDDKGEPFMLGKGAYGAVFKGTLGVRTVAIKVIHNNSSKEQQRFVREIATLRALHDPNIVMFLGACMQRNKTLLVMEYLPNGNLWDAIRGDANRQLGWYGRGRRIALDVAAGMAYLHSKRIVHLDLKTPNILLGEHLTARVADIGLGKTLAGVDVKASSATFLWAAPEQLQALPCTEAADVFSFGVVLWEICSGEAPLQRSMRPLRVPEECPQAVADLVVRCINAVPAARPRMDQIFTILESTSA
ncbi:hypothetical protein WJX74_009814 [Apatococcus lobatus]|uniref:Protein kinase domain-containing protein n=1 Tax=Apatococcus lobatus TaxID=904363 RepID=A0AAW1RHI0_9CHLO